MTIRNGIKAASFHMKTLVLVIVLTVFAFAQASVDQFSLSKGTAKVAMIGDTFYSPMTLIKFAKPFYLVKESDGVYRVNISATGLLAGCSISAIDGGGNANFSCGGLNATDRTKPGEAVLLELGVNGDAYVSIIAPAKVSATYRMQPPSDPPTEGASLRWHAPDPLTHIAVSYWVAP